MSLVSLQATIIVFQAIADYMVAVPLVQDVNLDVELSLSGRSKPVKWKISNDNIYMPRSEKVRRRRLEKPSITGSVITSWGLF